LEEDVISESHPFGDDLQKISREDLGLHVLDKQGNIISLNDPDYMLRVTSGKAAPFKFQYTSKNFEFITNKENEIKKMPVVGRVYLRANIYNPITGKKDDQSLRVYLFDRVIL